MRKRMPSIKTLSEVFSDPKQARAILRMNRAELMTLWACQERARECFNPPRTYDLRMTALNSLESGLFGVQGVETESGEFAEYLNAGDMYNATLLRWRGNYRVTTVGDFVEVMERNGMKFK